QRRLAVRGAQVERPHVGGPFRVRGTRRQRQPGHGEQGGSRSRAGRAGRGRDWRGAAAPGECHSLAPFGTLGQALIRPTNSSFCEAPMASVAIKVPGVGESITEGILARWLKPDGSAVAAGEPLFELETDKATTIVPAPAAGTLKIRVK